MRERFPLRLWARLITQRTLIWIERFSHEWNAYLIVSISAGGPHRFFHSPK